MLWPKGIRLKTVGKVIPMEVLLLLPFPLHIFLFQVICRENVGQKGKTQGSMRSRRRNRHCLRLNPTSGACSTQNTLNCCPPSSTCPSKWNALCYTGTILHSKPKSTQKYQKVPKSIKKYHNIQLSAAHHHLPLGLKYNVLQWLMVWFCTDGQQRWSSQNRSAEYQ